MNADQYSKLNLTKATIKNHQEFDWINLVTVMDCQPTNMFCWFHSQRYFFLSFFLLTWKNVQLDFKAKTRLVAHPSLSRYYIWGILQLSPGCKLTFFMDEYVVFANLWICARANCPETVFLIHFQAGIHVCYSWHPSTLYSAGAARIMTNLRPWSWALGTALCNS